MFPRNIAPPGDISSNCFSRAHPETPTHRQHGDVSNNSICGSGVLRCGSSGLRCSYDKCWCGGHPEYRQTAAAPAAIIVALLVDQDDGRKGQRLPQEGFLDCTFHTFCGHG